MNYTAGLIDAVARAIAKGIAETAQVDRLKADGQYKAHIIAMTAEDAALFEDYVLEAAMNIRIKIGYQG